MASDEQAAFPPALRAPSQRFFAFTTRRGWVAIEQDPMEPSRFRTVPGRQYLYDHEILQKEDVPAISVKPENRGNFEIEHALFEHTMPVRFEYTGKQYEEAPISFRVNNHFYIFHYALERYRWVKSNCYWSPLAGR